METPTETNTPHSSRGVELNATQHQLDSRSEPLSTRQGQSLDKLAIAQISTDPGSIGDNLGKILDAIKQAKAAGMKLITFPELAVPGYCSFDLTHDKRFLEHNAMAIEAIRRESEGIAVAVGVLTTDGDKNGAGGKAYVQNSVALIHNGKVKLLQAKSNIPNYGPFRESIWFEGASEQTVVDIDGTKVGIVICEDLWSDGYAKDIVSELKERGAELILSANASPFEVGKFEKRLEVIQQSAQENALPIVYTNLVGSFDGIGAEVVFDGRSVVVNPSGEIRFLADSFTEQLSFIHLSDESKQPISERQEIHEIHDAIILGMKEFFRRSRGEKAVIGLSGGIDSAVVAALAVEALGPENVIGVTMPSHITSGETKSDAYRLATNLGIKIIEAPIVDEYRVWLREYRRIHGKEPGAITKQNTQARIRGKNLMAISNDTPGALVLATGNKTEIALGYCTLYGDTSGALAPIGDCSKLRVYALAEYCNLVARRELVPETTITRAPSAELEEGQSDADSLPADYDVLDPLVEAIVEDRADYEELIRNFSPSVAKEVLSLIHRNEFKRRQLAPAIRVTKRALGLDWRMPMSSSFYGEQTVLPLGNA